MGNTSALTDRISRSNFPPSSPASFHSALFLPPGRPRPLARRLAIHNRVVGGIRSFLAEKGFVEVPVPALTGRRTAIEEVDSTFTADYYGDAVHLSQSGWRELDRMIERGFPAVWCESESLRKEWKTDDRHLTGFKLIELEKQEMDLEGLCDFQEEMLKTVAEDLSADLLGGKHVTRLDRSLRVQHPRLTYTEALKVLNERGWSFSFGEDFNPEAEATLNRYCGNLPLMVTHFPRVLKPMPLQCLQVNTQLTESVEYILPYAGETMDGGVCRGSQPRAGTGLGVARLLQFLMGLQSIGDAVIHPISRQTFHPEAADQEHDEFGSLRRLAGEA